MTSVLEPERRRRTRISLRLLCRIQGNRVAIAENISRDGLLLRWPSSRSLPVVGARLQVEVELPNQQLPPRRLRCGSTVVRVARDSQGGHEVGLRVTSMSFVAGPAIPRPEVWVN